MAANSATSLLGGTSGSTGSVSSPTPTNTGMLWEPEATKRSPHIGSIMDDIRNRLRCYRSDWEFGLGLIAPATYIFFASVIPALTFGEQIADETNNAFGGSQVLAATAICGVIQSIFGGQPMLIVGVAEPIILVYVFLHEFAEDQNIPYRPWCAVTLFWTAAMIIVLALMRTCKHIHSFTRFSGELFGFLIALLFIQQGFKGTTEEFAPNKYLNGSTEPAAIIAEEYQWRLFNGTFAVLVAFGFIVTTLLLRTARDWNLLTPLFRRLLAEYSTFIMVMIWTAISYIPQNTPESIPRRLVIEATTSANSMEAWNTITRLDELEGWHIGAAAVPAFIITVLFYFDHNVSSQLAQVPEFNLTKPDAYHWDFFLLGLMTALCGFLGMPPINGVLPQAPMHTRSCAEVVKEGVDGKPGFRVREQRWTNLIQSLLCGGCMFITDILQTIPRSVLWGFFIFMAIESLPGSQFFDRMKLFFTDETALPKLVRGQHNAFLDTVPLKQVLLFTSLQIFGLLICYGITWAGAIGVIFPVFIMALVPFRKFAMKKMFRQEYLVALDPFGNDEMNEILDVPATGTVGDIAAIQSTRVSAYDVLKGFFKYQAWYPHQEVKVALKLPDITPLLLNSLQTGAITQEEYDHMSATMDRARLSEE